MENIPQAFSANAKLCVIVSQLLTAPCPKTTVDGPLFRAS